MSETAPLVSDDLKEYEAEGLDISGFRLMPEFKYTIYGDNNVFATPDDKRKQLVMNFAGTLEARRRIGDLDFAARADGAIRRSLSLSTENTEEAATRLAVNWQPTVSQKIGLSGGWQRVVEERGSPESLQSPATSARLLNIFETQANFRKEGGVMLLASDFAWRKYDFLGTANDLRDFSSLFGSVTVGRSIGSRLYGTATAYVTNRDYRLPLPAPDGNQDETTIGGRLGIATRDRGPIEGRASIGLFRLDPANAAQKNRSGVSADVALILRPQRRTAVTLNVFSGDVATFRLGAIARADTTASAGIQQEIRHNLYATARLSYLNVKFIGSTDVEKAVSPYFAVEWLAGKTLSVTGYATFTSRTSNIAEENFDRFRAGVSLRLRY